MSSSDSSSLASLQASFEDNLVREDRYKLILGGLWITIVISLGATAFGSVFGGFIC